MSFQLSFSRHHKYTDSGSGIPLKATLRFGGAEAICTAKVDPGAQYCLFSRETAEKLGIDVESGIRRNLGTLTGSFIAYSHDVTLTTLDVELESHLCFAKDYDLPRNLLGRIGWLQLIRLAIIDYDLELYLSRYNEEF